MNIKVCGITQLKQLQQLDGLDIPFAGIIFYKKSPRYAGNKISKEELQSSDFDLKKVGIFVNQEYEEIMEVAEGYDLDVVQLHGDESPHLCEKISEHKEVIKAFRINTSNEQNVDRMIKEYDEVCDYYLFDTAGPSFGGNGTSFDWKVLGESKIEKPFFLSGGIGLEDASRIKAFKHLDFYGVDINSKFEKEPGVKDMAKVLQFRQAFKK